IVHELVAAMRQWPTADFVVASPHLAPGGYKNVPSNRVFYSKFGNYVIRTFMSNAASMNTGMTRAYRREMIQTLPTHENEKEFHLEVMLKATGMGYRFREIPAILEWKNYKHEGKRVKRKSSSKVNKLIRTHTLFSIFATPLRYVWGLTGLTFFGGLGFLLWALILYLQGGVAAFNALMGVLLLVLSIVLFVMGVVLQQGNMIQRELWLMQQDRLVQARGRQAAPQEYAFEGNGRFPQSESPQHNS
ncbi:MAG: hypothetical protein KC425_27090, partial [Anaerolineales bacterium]|nr:hypothetical protein [Anaerolineales bacterium]